jgi:hypothetical protein
MIDTVHAEPWRGLPAEAADVIEPELPAVTGEILATIAREVPEYARPFEGSFGRGIRTGVTEALRQFVALIRDPEAGRGPGREVYVGLGRGELHQGRTLDSLQSAYRIGARVAWRHLAASGREGGLDPEVLSLLAESIFAYIDELSADSVEGFARAQSEREGERQRRRRELVRLLLRRPPVDDPELTAAAQPAGWRVPNSLAALACPEEDVASLARRLPAESLVATIEGVGCILLSDPSGPGRVEEAARAAEGRLASIGPAGGRGELAPSWSLARAVLRAREAGVVGGDGLLRADDYLAELLLFENRDLVDRIANRRLAPFENLTEKARLRMEETALAYVQNQGNAVAIAHSLHIHPQTARYRLIRLRELIGKGIDDPSTRFELEIALRARRRSD